MAHNTVAKLHKASDCSGRGVEDGHAVFFNDLPEPIVAWMIRHAFEHHLRTAIAQRPVDNIAVARDPADIGGAPEDVGFGLEVEDVLVGVGDLSEIAAGGVHDALGLTRGPRGVEQEEQVLGFHRLGRAVG